MDLENTLILKENHSTKYNSPTPLPEESVQSLDYPPINKYDDLIPRKLMEALTGVPVHTIIKYESEGLITPIRTKAGALDMVCYRIKDVMAVLKKRGVSLKKKKEAEVIAVWSQKGGVGKTALTQHLAALMSIFGKTLVIDIDSQADATSMLGQNVKYGDVVGEDVELEPTIAELIDWNLSEEYEGAYQHLPFERVVKKITPTLHLIPSDLDLAEINYFFLSCHNISLSI